MNALVIAFFVWFSYDVIVELLLMTSTRQSAMSANVIFDSFLLYFPADLRYLSIA